MINHNPEDPQSTQMTSASAAV